MINCVTCIDLTLGHHRREHVRWINYPWNLCGPVPQLFILLGVQFHMSMSFGLWQVAAVYLNVYLWHKCSPESHRASKSWCQVFCVSLEFTAEKSLFLHTTWAFYRQQGTFHKSCCSKYQKYFVFLKVWNSLSYHVSQVCHRVQRGGIFIMWREQSPAITWIAWSASALL